MTNSSIGHLPSIQPIKTRPKTPEFDTDKAREAAVSAIEQQQKKANAEQYIKTSANLRDDNNRYYFNDLQDLAQLVKVNQVAQVVDNNDANRIKEVAELKQQKIEAFFRRINDPKESNAINSFA